MPWTYSNGLAQRADYILQSARSEHSIWLAQFSRALAPAVDTGKHKLAAKDVGSAQERIDALRKACKPGMVLSVKAVLDERRAEAQGVALVRARIEREPDDDDDDVVVVVDDGDEGPQDEELEGLVLLSAPEHQHATSSRGGGGGGRASGGGIAAALMAAKQARHQARNSDDPGEETIAARKRRDGKVSLIAPFNASEFATALEEIKLAPTTTQHKLWVWEPVHELVLPQTHQERDEGKQRQRALACPRFAFLTVTR